MDFTKFAALLEGGALYFPSVAALTKFDLFEGSLSAPVVEMLRSGPLKAGKTVEEAAEIAENNLRVMGLARQLLYVNCWHQNNYESAAMWRLYLQSGEGIAIRSSIGSLKAAIAPETESIYIGGVKYIDYQADSLPWDNGMYLALHKRRSFEHEREVRLLLFGGWNANGMNVKVSLPDLLGTIYVAPNSEDWFRDLVEAVVKRYGLDVPVQRSSLEIGPLY